MSSRRLEVMRGNKLGELHQTTSSPTRCRAADREESSYGDL
ncbi:hypothetical protein CIHG_07710 [Coccidioides immitis H538.4]|uniref:Uncharacterized protein n=3 Tax=Coccidioides immitis TaxID=5501 RepID=A0A0J8QTA3_COCIT|nr:hypothetical protein CIRG_04182 [Coccidioides immitis RMSCC 2394]KMU76079.1 hypothetical protein CISG_05337 [Coccidioides immitis RMSCC 3703]KMU90027.1 hypothetical protein CIHG_07710 [Coccidioides immitis H538.4]